MQPHGLLHTRLFLLSSTISWSLLNFMSIEPVMLSNYLFLCRPLLLLPLLFPSIRVFNELAPCIRWPKYWSISFCIGLSNEYPGLISFRIDCFYLLAVQQMLKSLLQHHNLKASILPGSAFFYGPIAVLACKLIPSLEGHFLPPQSTFLTNPQQYKSQFRLLFRLDFQYS